MNFYLADMHFGHKNIITYDNRPYSTTQEMDRALIANWNDVVTDNDTVYVLGDMFWITEDAEKIIQQLKGKKVLIVGNHDKCATTLNMIKYWEYCADTAIVQEGKQFVVLSHYPIMFYRNMYRGWYHFYGHIHNSQDHNMTESFAKQISELTAQEWKGYNVGVMMPYMNYAPRTFEEIVEGARKERNNG